MNKIVLSLTCCLVLVAPSLGATIVVSASATGSGDGKSWINAKTDLAAAVSGAKAGDEIWVAIGMYGPVVLKNGVRVFGGFNGTETTASQSNPEANGTTISGGSAARAVTSIGNDSSTVLRGFRIVDGFIAFPHTGGGVYAENSDATFIRCMFTRNKSGTMGGAVANWGGSPSYINCEFFGNSAEMAAGAVWNRKGATPSFVNCLFYDNHAKEAGAVSVLDGSPSFTNCTFTDNHASKGKAGAIFDTRGEVVLRNCIVWNNKAARSGTNELYNLPAGGGKSTATHCNIAGGWTGSGNLSADPLFINAAARDYRLRLNSPCRNKGDSSRLPDDLADLDLDGQTSLTLTRDLAMNPRVTGSAVNMGAYE